MLVLFEFIPTQSIVEVKRGVRVNTERKIFPGYILIKMQLNDDTWHIIKNTPKLSGFLGNKGQPVPISNAEAKRISQQVIDGVEKSRPAVMYDVGAGGAARSDRQRHSLHPL